MQVNSNRLFFTFIDQDNETTLEKIFPILLRYEHQCKISVFYILNKSWLLLVVQFQFFHRNFYFCCCFYDTQFLKFPPPPPQSDATPFPPPDPSMVQVGKGCGDGWLRWSVGAWFRCVEAKMQMMGWGVVWGQRGNLGGGGGGS